MTKTRESAYRDLKRLLANGPLTGVPRRPSDQDLLVALAASRFDAQASYGEGEVNETLKAWLQTFSRACRNPQRSGVQEAPAP